MSSLGEELAVLLDLCDGLKARAHYMYKFKEPEMITQDLGKLLKQALKSWPNKPSGFEKSPGYELFRDRSTEVATLLEEYYMHLVHFMIFRKKTLLLLQRVSSKVPLLLFEVNQTIMIQFFDLLVGYCQLTHLVARLPLRKDAAMIYMLAHESSKRAQEPSWTPLSAFLSMLDNPWALVRSECQGLSAYVGKSIAQVKDIFMEVYQITTIHQNNLFDPLDRFDDLGDSEILSSVYHKLALSHRFAYWVAYSYLSCPAELQTPEARSLICFTCSMHAVIPVFREVMISIHTEFELLFNDFKIDKFRLSKHKDVWKKATADYAKTGWSDHQRLRIVLCIQCERLACFLKDYPAVLGPKIDVVFAAMRFLRSEIMWYFRHITYEAQQGRIKSEEVHVDDKLPLLFHVLYQLVLIVGENRHVIQLFSLDYLRSRLKTAESGLRSVAQLPSADGQCTVLLGKMLSHIDYATNESSFAEFRQQWLFCSSSLSESMTQEAAKEVLSLMTYLCIRSRCIDALNMEIHEASACYDVWYFWRLFSSIFSASLTQPSTACCFSAMLRVFDDAFNNVHRFCPEEQQLISEKSSDLAEGLILEVVDQVKHVLASIYDHESTLLKKTRPAEALKRYHAIQEGKVVRERSGEPLPGYESLQANRPYLDDIRELSRLRLLLSQLLYACRTFQKTRVVELVFCAAEFIREGIHSFVLDKLTGLATDSSVSSIVPPSVLYARTSILVKTVQSTASYLNIDIKSILSHALLQNAVHVAHHQSFRPNTYPRTKAAKKLVKSQSSFMKVKAVFEAKESNEEHSPPTVGDTSLIGKYCEAYTAFITKSLHATGTYYVDVTQGFVRGRKRSTTDGDFMLKFPHHFVRIEELEFFCRTFGIYGVRYLESHLLSIIRKHFIDIKFILALNRDTLSQVSNRLTNRNVWYGTFKHLKQLNEFSKSIILVGQVLQFRQLLLQALHGVIEAKHELLCGTIASLDRMLKPHVFPVDVDDTRLDSFYSAVQDIGLTQAGHDISILHVLAPLCESRSDTESWNCLPEMLGFFFLSDVWKRVRYRSDHNAFDNNGHLAIIVIETLLRGVSHMCTMVEKSTKPEIFERGEEAPKTLSTREGDIRLKEFLKHGSFSLMHMLTGKQGEWTDHDPEVMLLFLDMFVSNVDTLTYGHLEEHFPHSILREQLIIVKERIMKQAEEEEEERDDTAAE